MYQHVPGFLPDRLQLGGVFAQPLAQAFADFLGPARKVVGEPLRHGAARALQDFRHLREQRGKAAAFAAHVHDDPETRGGNSPEDQQRDDADRGTLGPPGRNVPVEERKEHVHELVDQQPGYHRRQQVEGQDENRAQHRQRPGGVFVDGRGSGG
jgi:hypothetical protein